MAPTVHVIGAGLAGLSAAVALAQRGARVVVHEATGQAGGRCRSYHDSATGLEIDNGTHLLLSGNAAALSYVRAIGSEDGLSGPGEARFPFVDLQTGARWTVELNDGLLPWWILDPGRRVPGTGLGEYLRLGRLLWPPRGSRIGDVVPCRGPLYERLVEPLLLAALNIDPPQGAARLAASVLRETLAAGGAACRPLIAEKGLGSVFVAPAVKFLERNGAEIRFRHELRGFVAQDDRVARLDFGEDAIDLERTDAVVVALPPTAAPSIVPGLEAPTEFRAIVNAHFRIEPPPEMPRILGVVNGTAEWIFAFADRLSVTVSDAGRLLETPREELAERLWREVSSVAGLPADLPRWQIVRERRATFAATPEQDKKRPRPATAWNNAVLAGDWTDTGLPATIEGAIRSGQRASELILKCMAAS